MSRCVVGGVLLPVFLLGGGCRLDYATRLACNTDLDCFGGHDCCNGSCQPAESLCLSTADDAYPSVPAGAYYIAAQGDGSDSADGMTPETAWSTFAHAFANIEPGDTLALLDGSHGPMRVDISGEDGAPITIMAANEGAARIVGDGLGFGPCEINGIDSEWLHHIHMLGLTCVSTEQNALFIGYAEDITVRRIVGLSTIGTANRSTVLMYETRNVLLEDAAVNGTAVVAVQVANSQGVTLRRVWARLEGGPASPSYIFLIGTTTDARLENCIATTSASISSFGFGLNSSNNTIMGSIAHDVLSAGFIVAAQSANIEGNRIENSVGVRTDRGLFQRADSNLTVARVTFGEVTNEMHRVHAVDCGGCQPPGFAINASVINTLMAGALVGFSVESTYVGSIGSTYNNIFQVQTPIIGVVNEGAGNLAQDPQLDTNTYGIGAYLVGSSELSNSGQDGGRLGAQILFRYEDEGLGRVPLWPWPMEDRIRAETGLSVTFEQAGGIWTTLDGVYE